LELRLSKRMARLVRANRKARRVRAIARVSDAAGNHATMAKTMRLRIAR